jgi:transposase
LYKREISSAETLGLTSLKRNESGRSEAEYDGLARSVSSDVQLVVPDPEVSPAIGRRRFAASYKARIVREADACTELGEIGALLRREGLYSSQLTAWRKQYRQGAETALTDDKRGRKVTKNPLSDENQRLCRELERTQKKLRQAELIIEFQKNLCEILGISPASVSSDEEK